jgi:hypothetical protein
VTQIETVDEFYQTTQLWMDGCFILMKIKIKKGGVNEWEWDY